MYDAVVIGGGLAGLYTAYRLQSKGMTCVLVESSRRLGGRVMSKKTTDGVVYECGAAKLLPSHKHTIGLIKELGFSTKDLVKFKKIITLKDIQERGILDDILNEIVKGVKRERYDIAINQTLKDWMTHKFPKDTIEYVLKASGYPHLFEHCNAHCGVHYIKRDLLAKELITFTPGLSSIITRLEEKFKEMGGKVIKGKKVHSLLHLPNGQGIKVAGLTTHAIVFAVPPRQLKCIKGLSKGVYDACDRVISIPLLRVFAHGDLGIIPYTHIGNEVQRMMSRSDKFYQLVYASDRNAVFWKKDVKGSFKETYCKLVGASRPQCRTIHNVEPHYWPQGVHLWGPGSDGALVWEDLKRGQKNIWVVGEAFCPYQRWMESAVLTAKDVVDALTSSVQQGSSP